MLSSLKFRFLPGILKVGVGSPSREPIQARETRVKPVVFTTGKVKEGRHSDFISRWIFWNFAPRYYYQAIDTTRKLSAIYVANIVATIGPLTVTSWSRYALNRRSFALSPSVAAAFNLEHLKQFWTPLGDTFALSLLISRVNISLIFT